MTTQQKVIKTKLGLLKLGKQLGNVCYFCSLRSTIICSIFFSILFYPFLSLAQSTVIIDNSDPGFSVVGYWQTYTNVSGFFGIDYRQTTAGSGDKQATWTFQIANPGQYEISAQWSPSANRAPNAPYTIRNNGQNLGTFPVDQRVNGGKFNVLGTFTLQAGTLVVTLTNDAAGNVIADATQVILKAPPPNQAPNGVIDSPAGNVTINVGGAVNFAGTGSDPDGNLPLSYLWNFGDPAISNLTAEDPGLVQFNNAGVYTVTFTVTDSLGLSDPTPAVVQITVNNLVPGSPIEIIVDNADPDFSTVGFWQTYSNVAGFYGADYRQAASGTGSKTATWTIRVSPGQYKIYARWTSTSNRAPNAPYTVKNNGQNIGTVLLDQRVNGGQFNLLGTYTLQQGTLDVVLSDNASGAVVADAVKISTSQAVRIVSPLHPGLEISQNVLIQALAVGFPSGWGVRFIVREKVSGNTVAQADDYTTPFSYLASGLSLREYTVDALEINASGVPQLPFTDRIDFGVGDYYVAFGDSITAASGDNITFDNVSADGRNKGGGHPPIVNNLLTTAKGYPHTVKNEGIGGNRSVNGLNRISTVLSDHPKAQYLLILFGTNDALGSPPVPSGKGLNPGAPGYAGTYKDNMQRIITAALNAGVLPLLAKVPYLSGSCNACAPFADPDTAPQNILIREYNDVVEELISANNIKLFPPALFVAPDLYNHFRDNFINNGGSQYFDRIHPNGLGYQSIANLWANSLKASP